MFPPHETSFSWRNMDFLREQVVDEESEKRSSTPPIYQSKVTPQQSFKLYLWHILGGYGHDPLLYHVYVSFSLEDTPEP